MPAFLALLLAAGIGQAADSPPKVTDHGHTACPSQGGFSVGDRIIHSDRGEGRLVCLSARRPDTIGVCQGIGSGHDNYKECAGIPERPSFCGERSLWFVRCRDLEAARTRSSTSTRLGDSTAVSHVDISRNRCGCSWSFQHGCVVSGGQTIASLAHPSMVERYCADGQNSERCELRRQVMETAKRFEHCLRLPSTSCYEDKMCQWGAQGAHQCGVDEEQLVLAAVGQKYRSHPLVRMVQLHDHCNALSEESCEADPFCTFDTYHQVPRCDVKPSVAASILLANPRFVIDMQQSAREAMCEAASQAPEDGVGKPACPPECVESSGLCVAKDQTERQKLSQVQDLYSVLCREAHDRCPTPCIRVSSIRIQGPGCLAPEFTADTIRKLPIHPSDLRVVQVVSLLHATTLPFQTVCEEMDRFGCQATAPVCPRSSVMPSWAQTAPQKGAASLPALKGVMAKAIRAISDGKAAEFVDDFLTNSPQAVPELTSAFAERFKHLWDTPAEEAPATASTTKLSRVITTTLSLKRSQGLHSRREDGEIPPADFGVKLPNPWILAAGSAVVAAICAGLAVGSLCHAQLLRSQTRELGGALLGIDHDLPSLSVDGTTDTAETPSAAILAQSEA